MLLHPSIPPVDEHRSSYRCSSETDMAMGQEGHRAIHPFFRKDAPILADNLAPTAVDNALDKTNGSSACEDPSKVTKDPEEPKVSNSQCREPSTSETAPVDNLEHDPNTSRRKRRRTDNHSHEGSTQGSIVNFVSVQHVIPTHKDQDPPAEEPAAQDKNGQAVTKSESPPADLPILPTLLPRPTSQEPAPADGLSPCAADEISATRKSTRTPQQKTIKLNSNGKLLSSPVSKKPDAENDKSGKKSNKKKKKSDKSEFRTKVVVFRYPPGEEGKVGKLIDDIIKGERKHIPPSAVPKPAPPPVKKDEPPKPTHPFFMKKPARKPDTQSSPAAQDAPSTTPKADTVQSDMNTPSRPSPSAFMKTLTFFKHRPSKNPDPIYPIWPPRDLSHVRGLNEDSVLQNSVTGPLLGLGPKKSKMAAVSISDKESVLSFDQQGISHDTPSVLRVPSRNVASGYTLQKAVTRQLSHNSRSSTHKDSLGATCHPAIARLHSSIPRTMSAFDRGDFDSQLWAQKYAPNSVDQVLQVTKETQMLRDWLKFLMISAVDTGKSKDGEKSKKSDDKKKKKRKKSDKLDGFVVSSSDEDYQMDELSDSDEDELAGDVTVSSKRTVVRGGNLSLTAGHGGERSRMPNAILLSGPPGSGKTASIFAAAKELDFEVFELNPGNRRTARDIVERVGDMTRNHLVHNLHGEEKTSSEAAASDEKQNKLKGFFKFSGNRGGKNVDQQKDKEPERTPDAKRARQQKQSFILLEEADILFEEDRQFWSGVMALINQSKRPIIITCNDERLLPLDDLSFHAILRFRPPPQHLAVDYLLLLAANEGHLLTREALNALYMGTGKDLRRSITELNFWCQMAVGSQKSGLDWIIDRWPRGRDLDVDGNPLRVISLNTYQQFMGWFSRDMLMGGTLDSEVEPERESLTVWGLSLQDSEQMSILDRAMPHPMNATKEENLEQLRRFSELNDSRSVLDILSRDCSVDTAKDILDTSIDSISEKQRGNYVEGYPLLTAEHLPSYTSVSPAIASTFTTLLRHDFQPGKPANVEVTQAAKVLAKMTQLKSTGPTHADLLHAFEPITKPDYVFPPPTGRVAPSFNNGIGPLAEDLGPYIRAIMAFDLRLEQHRMQLSGVLFQEGSGTKRVRKTRASRAALEGGSKAETRKERWFPPDTNASLILGTGKREWQELLVRGGYFTVSGGEAVAVPEVGESSSEGGI